MQADPDVVFRWRDLNEPIEGWTTWMYLDTHKPDPLVSGGLGCLMDPVETILHLPWTIGEGGGPAAQDRIRQEHATLKANPSRSRYTALSQRQFTLLRITDAAATELFKQRLAADQAILEQHPAFAARAHWPVGARLVLASIAWAIGAGFGPKWPHFSAACAKQDWAEARRQCLIDNPHNDAALARRNVMNQELLGAP